MQTDTKRGLVLGSVYVREFTSINIDALRGAPVKPRYGYAYRPDFVVPAIRRNILFYDEIEWPGISFDGTPFTQGEPPEIDLLVRQQIISRRFVELDNTPGNLGHPVRDTLNVHAQVFQQFDRAEPGKWLYAPIGPEVDLWTLTPLINCTAIEIELYNRLPMPEVEVEFAEILDFKSRRQPELLQFRSFMDDLYLEAINSRDVPRSKSLALRKLDSAIDDLAAVLNTSTVRWVWSSIVVPVLVEPARGAAEAGGAAELSGAPKEFVVAAAVTGALFKFANIKIESPVSRVGPLACFYRAAKEGILKPPIT